jgi:multidrug efflux pump subunit AcrB
LRFKNSCKSSLKFVSAVGLHRDDRLSLVVVGSASYFKLGVDRFPSVDLPPSACAQICRAPLPEEMETLVSQPIEELSIPSMASISTFSFGANNRS